MCASGYTLPSPRGSRLPETGLLETQTSNGVLSVQASPILVPPCGTIVAFGKDSSLNMLQGSSDVRRYLDTMYPSCQPQRI